MFYDDDIIPIAIAGLALVLGFILGIPVGVKLDNSDYLCRQTYCPKIYQKTDQYIQCMNKPFSDTLKAVLTNK